MFRKHKLWYTLDLRYIQNSMLAIRPTVPKPTTKSKGSALPAPPAIFEEEDISGDLRLRSRDLLQRIVKESGVYADDAVNERIARDLECCILVDSKSHLFAYRKKLNQITYNLANNGPFLLSSYYPWELAFINNAALGQNTKEELAIQKHKAQIQMFQDDLAATLKVLKAKAAVDRSVTGASQVRCRACKSTNIFDFQKQTRAADEGMTWFFTCRNCGKTGRLS